MDCIERCTTELLRRHDGRALTLQQLHALLVLELGPSAGTYHQLLQRLKKTAAPLRILERYHSLPADLDWPADTRKLYEQALHAAGYDDSPIVALTAGTEDAPTVLDDLRATLLDLSARLPRDERFNVDIIEALTGLSDLQRESAAAAQPTTPPRDLP